MKGKDAMKALGIAVAGTLADKAVEKAPEFIERIAKKKEEKSFLEENKSWIYLIIISIFVTKLDYINIFSNTIINPIINIVFGIILFILLYLFTNEESKNFKSSNVFIKALIISVIVLGLINSISHIGYAVCNLFEVV